MRIQAKQNDFGHIDFRFYKKYNNIMLPFDANLYLQAESDVDCFLAYLTIEDKEAINECWIDVHKNNPFYDYIVEVNK